MNFEGVLETLKRNKEQPTIEEYELQNNQCPIHAWPLKVREDGKKSCPVGGEVYD